jgi:hopene-associated glycosyltransferase HpnB
LLTLDLLVSLALLAWLYLAFFHARFWKPLVEKQHIDPESWPSIHVIVPARNEADLLPVTLKSLLTQDYPGAWRVILVDDHSSDGTAKVAEDTALKNNAALRLNVVHAPEKPAGWAGKVAAMQAGVAESNADYILFTDADIWHDPHSLRRLAAEAVETRSDLTSRMVLLHCASVAEQLLIPAFVFFFSMLYPFRRARDPESKVAAAAGGVMLVKRKALENIGGLVSIKSSIIDDCSLAKAIKKAGGRDMSPGRISLSMTQRVKSLRPYPEIEDVWRMIARAAFTQLRHSPFLLAGTVTGMSLLFFVPALALVFGNPLAISLGFFTWTVMFLLYLPMVHFYRIPLVWAVTMPGAAAVYIGATIDSARLYWQGKGGQWKGRVQA